MKKLILSILLAALALLFHVHSNAQCITADAGPDKSICSNGQTIIGTPAQPGYSYSWTPARGLNNPNIAQPIASPGFLTHYQLIVTPNNLPNLIVNGGFESGNTAFSSDYLIWPQSLQPGGYGSYLISNDARNMRNYFYSTAHTPGSNLMMVVDGSTAGNAHVVWRQQVNNISQNSFYKFSLFVCAISGNNAVPPGLPDLTIRINGTAIGNGWPPPNTLGTWGKVEGVWNSGGNTTATIELVDNSNWSTNNDFAIDDLEFVQACSNTSVDPHDEVSVGVYQDQQFYRLSSVYTQEGSGPLIARSNNYENVCYGWESSMKEILTSPFGNTIWHINDKVVDNGYYPGIGLVEITNSQTLTLYPDDIRWKTYRFVASDGSMECPGLSTYTTWTTFVATYYPGSNSYINGNNLGIVYNRNTWTNIKPHLANMSGTSMFDYTFPPGIDYQDNDIYDPDFLINVTNSYAGPLYFAGADLYYIPVVAYNNIYCTDNYNVYITVPNPFRKATGNTPIETVDSTLDKKIGIFPNPASDFIFVQPDASFGTTYKLEIVNMLGQIVQSRMVSKQDRSVLKVTLDKLPAGVYNLIIRTGQKTFNKKFMVGR